ncbi:MAG: hypothetical protein HY560_06565 [Gemmatimonadetes bacterium]|nr:hypothetical protein [Gemmatimonadota bacterium]
MRSLVLGAVKDRLGQLRAHPAWHPRAVWENWRDRAGGHAVASGHRPHLTDAIEWLVRAQDAAPDDGFARGYSLTWNPYFGARGWQPSYPETTGYIIPTFYQAARQLQQPDLAARAGRAARWEIGIQLSSGAVRAGVVGQPIAPAVFNTGQVMLGWLAAFRETGDAAFADAARRAGRFLVSMLDADGLWRRGNSPFANPKATLYNTRTAWALAEVGKWLDAPDFREAAARSLVAVARLRHANGWIPDCCLSDDRHPLLHTIAYAIRGFLEGGRVLEDARLIGRAAIAADQIATRVGPDGWLPGRLGPDWHAAVSWSCLTGEAQMVNVWLRLFEITGAGRWLEPVPAVLRFLKSTQNRASRDPGLRGGIKGSFPVDGEYGRYEVLNWATKFFADALMRDERISAGVHTGESEPILFA